MPTPDLAAGSRDAGAEGGEGRMIVGGRRANHSLALAATQPIPDPLAGARGYAHDPDSAGSGQRDPLTRANSRCA